MITASCRRSSLISRHRRSCRVCASRGSMKPNTTEQGLVRAFMRVRELDYQAYMQLVESFQLMQADALAALLQAPKEALDKAQGMALMSHRIMVTARDAAKLLDEMKG